MIIGVCVNVGNSPVCSATVVKVNFTLTSQEGICLRASDWSSHPIDVGVFDFSRIFPHVFDTNMVCKTQVKMREECEKNAKNARKIKNASPTRKICSILHLRFSCVFSHILLAFLLTNFTKTQPQRRVLYGLKGQFMMKSQALAKCT